MNNRSQLSTRAGGVSLVAVGVLGLASALMLLHGVKANAEEIVPVKTAVESVAFTGPWASEFSEAYSRAMSDGERAALSDGLISTAEFDSMRAQFTGCLAQHGIDDLAFGVDGSFSFNIASGAGADETRAMVDECSRASGEDTVGALASWIARNPENQDEGTIMAACLVRHHAVADSYTAEKYRQDIPSRELPFTTSQGEAILRDCEQDPLNLLN